MMISLNIVYLKTTKLFSTADIKNGV